MSNLSIEQEKAALRRQARKIRAVLGPGFRADAAEAVATNLRAASLIPAGAVIAGYWPIRDELDCRPLLEALQAAGHPVALPVVQGPDQPLLWRLWRHGAPLVEAGFGSQAPDEHAPVVSPQIMLLPLLGFDATGTRLGYGGGYYDRSIAALSPRPQRIGFAFAAQELRYIPRESHDWPLDAVVTETGLRYFGFP